MKRLVLSFTILFFAVVSFAQFKTSSDAVKWDFKAQKTGDSTFDLLISANIAGDYHIYSFDPGGDGTLIFPEFKFGKNANVKLLGKMKESGKLLHEDTKDVMGVINYFKHKVSYSQKAIVTANTSLKGSVYFTACDDKGCLSPDDLKFQIKFDGLNVTANTDTASINGDTAAVAGANTGNQQTATTKLATQGNSKVELKNEEANPESHSLWGIFLKGFIQGLIAFVTPCIFSMLPITVSFFTKRSKTKAAGLKNATFYSLSIVSIFALIGILISLFFKEDTMYIISSSIWFNLFVFIIFIVFGISLLGAFEITLPSSWSSKLDSKANTNSFGGIFFMAMVLVVVSCSGTSACISLLIVDIVQSHNRLGGVAGFFGFGLALALPFALFAYFPGLLNSMAKAGGWLNSVKVTMGFVELGLAMKFLSNVDLQYHWGLLNYDVYISIWIALAGLLGLYLIGKIRFSHDDELPKNMFGHPHLSVTRLMFAIASFSFMVYLLPGLWGAPLTGISGLLPERKTLEFNVHDNLIRLQTNQGTYTGSSQVDQEVMPVKYTSTLKSELPGITAYFDYHEALAAAKKTGKPVLLDFTGHSCINCRKMERAVLSKPEIMRELKEHFILASLYCDDRGALDKEDIYTNSKGQLIETIGAKNIDIEVNKYGAIGQPAYIFVDADGNVLKNAGGYEDDVPRFLKIINEVKEAHKQHK